MAVSEKTPVNKGPDKLKWLLIFVLLIASVVGNVYFSTVSESLRAAALIILAVILLALAKTTSQGNAAWRFLTEARMEMRKVVWPTRQETLQTTGLVIAFVAIMSLILWGVDSLFAIIISSIIG